MTFINSGLSYSIQTFHQRGCRWSFHMQNVSFNWVSARSIRPHHRLAFPGSVTDCGIEYETHDGSRQEQAKVILYMKFHICASKLVRVVSVNGHASKSHCLLNPGEILNYCMFCHRCVQPLCSECHTEAVPPLSVVVDVHCGVLHSWCSVPPTPHAGEWTQGTVVH